MYKRQAHALRAFYCLDFLARISHQPFVKNVPQRGKIIFPLCAVHSVIAVSYTHLRIGGGLLLLQKQVHLVDVVTGGLVGGTVDGNAV